MGKILLPQKNIITGGRVGMGGAYRLQTRKYKSGKLHHDTGWFDNLITDGGIWQYHSLPKPSSFDNMGEIVDNVCVGTGNTAPSFSDTQLANYVAKSARGGSGLNNGTGFVPAASPVPAYWYARGNFQFGTGVAAGNLSEVGAFPFGVPWNGGGEVVYDQTTLFSRALILDGAGNPTTITVLSDEILTVYYELRFYVDTTDHAFTFNLNGSPITGTYRVMDYDGYDLGAHGQQQVSSGNYIGVSVYSGAMGAANSSPSGSLGLQATSSGDILSIDQVVNDLANSNTCYMDLHCTFPINEGNGTINSFSITDGMWNYQFGNLSTPIVKTTGQQLQTAFRLSWGRYTPP